MQQFAELEEALAERDERLAALEEVLGKRTAQMEERNAEYWAAREELAELQEQAERSREIRSTVEDLEARLQLSEESAATTAARAHELEKMRAQMQHANTEVRTLTERCAGQERELEELRDQVERAIAIQKFSEEEIKKL